MGKDYYAGLRLGKSQKAVLDYMRKHRGWHVAKSIGEAVGGPTPAGAMRGAEWSCPILAGLLKKGMVEHDAAKGRWRWAGRP